MTSMLNRRFFKTRYHFSQRNKINFSIQFTVRGIRNICPT